MARAESAHQLGCVGLGIQVWWFGWTRTPRWVYSSEAERRRSQVAGRELPMPEIHFVHFEEVEPWSVLPQLHGERRASVHLHVLEQSDDRFVSYTRYDPDYVVEAHRHKGDQLIHVLEGEMTVGDHACRKGTTIILPQGAVLGPIVAGPQGAHILEVFLGKDANHPIAVDTGASQELFASRGIEPLFDVHGARTSERPGASTPPGRHQ